LTFTPLAHHNLNKIHNLSVVAEKIITIIMNYINGCLAGPEINPNEAFLGPCNHQKLTKEEK